MYFVNQEQKIKYLEKGNYWYEKIHKLEIESVEERIKNTAEKRNDPEICAFVSDGKLREKCVNFILFVRQT